MNRCVKETITLFNGVYQDKNEAKFCALNANTLTKGFILDSSINLTVGELKDIDAILGMNGEQSNASFHKSWKTIEESSIEDLVIQQMLHYLTTYGFEALGIEDDYIYIPSEKLDIPNITVDNLKLIRIKALSKTDILNEIISLVSTGVALHTNTINDLMTIITELDLVINMTLVKNKELKSKLCKLYNIVPENPTEWVRYAVEKLTGESMLIKNKAMITAIKGSAYAKLQPLDTNSIGNMVDMSVLIPTIPEDNKVDDLMKTAPADLASVFFRFKPLLLAMKSICNNKTFFNQLRKKANKMHKAMPIDYLNQVTAMCKNKMLYIDTLEEALAKVNVFRKVRLLYAIKFQMTDCESVVYQVRNGKGFMKDRAVPSADTLSFYNDAYNSIYKSVCNDIGANVKDKNIFLPEYMHYALPATEKQFCGNLPANSYVEVEDNMIAGIWWQNEMKDGKEVRIDLDLGSVDMFGKTGWDGSYRNENVTFSGDLTDAPRSKGGASELFHYKNSSSPTSSLTLNYFNYREDVPVTCKVFVGQGTKEDAQKDFVFDPNKLITCQTIIVDEEQSVIGVVDGKKMIFGSVSFGNCNTSKVSDSINKLNAFNRAKLDNTIDFGQVLKDAGANIVEDIANAEIDLSPEALTKTTFIDLLTKEI